MRSIGGIRHGFLTRNLAAAALVVLYCLSALGLSGLLMATGLPSAQAQRGRGKKMWPSSYPPGRGTPRRAGRRVSSAAYCRGRGYCGRLGSVRRGVVRSRGRRDYWDPAQEYTQRKQIEQRSKPAEQRSKHTDQPVRPSQAVEEFVADEVLVTADLSAPQSLEEGLARDYGLQVIERLDLTLIDRRILRMRIPNGRAVRIVVAALQSDQRIEDPQPNYLYRHQAGASGVTTGEPQYALNKIELSRAHALAQGRGTIVAIIDSAVDLTHPDLDAVATETFDAVGDADARTDAHGTAIAGIIRGRGALQGVAPRATLLCVRVFTPRLARDPAAATNALLRGLDWSVKRGARVVNLSFVGPRDPLVHKMLKAAVNKQAVIVAPAGNGGVGAPPAYPGAYSEVIAVTATDHADRLYNQANRGAYVAVAAPGVDILTPTLGREHEHKTGTSFAAAHVSGIIALMLERNPHLTPKAVRAALVAAAQDLGSRGHDKEFGAGRTNAFKSLRVIGQTTKVSH